MRLRPDARRPAEMFNVIHKTPDGVDFEFMLSIGRVNPDFTGAINEVFVDIPWSGKSQTSLTTLAAKDAALLISIALQHGATIDELADGMGRSEYPEMGKSVERPHTMIGTILNTLRSIQ